LCSIDRGDQTFGWKLVVSLGFLWLLQTLLQLAIVALSHWGGRCLVLKKVIFIQYLVFGSQVHGIKWVVFGLLRQNLSLPSTFPNAFHQKPNSWSLRNCHKRNQGKSTNVIQLVFQHSPVHSERKQPCDSIIRHIFCDLTYTSQLYIFLHCNYIAYPFMEKKIGFNSMLEAKIYMRTKIFFNTKSAGTRGNQKYREGKQ